MRALIDGQEIDIAPDELPAFTFSIEDSLDIGSSRGARSTTMRLPMTNRNRSVIGGHAIGERATDSFTFSVRNGTASYFDGVCLVRERTPFDASVVAFGDNASWMSLLRGKGLREVGYGWSYSHGVNPTTNTIVEDSWAGTGPIVFPLIDYGQWEEAPPGFSVVNSVLHPCMFVRHALGVAFSEIGFGIAGAGSFKATFDKLIVPPVNGPLYGFPSVGPSDLVDDPTAAGFIYLPAILPKRSVIDFLGDICRLYCVLPVTNGSLVELWHYDDLFPSVPQTNPIDITKRSQGYPAKVTDGAPRAFVFKMAEDKEDVALDSIATGGFRVRQEVDGGTDEEQEVSVAFAPTWTFIDEVGVRIPIMRQRNAQGTPGTYPVNRSRTERLLLWEGMRPGNWTYRGGARTTYPSAIGYGDGVASSGTTMFFDVTDQTGTVRKHWLNRVTRWTAPRLKLDAIWADHEIAALDVTRQVKASDGIIDGIYYVLEINQHRFGIGEPSETTLVPL